MIYILNDNFCNSQVGYKIMGTLGIILSIIKIIVPILLIVVGTIDLVKCLVSQNGDTPKIIKKLLTKVICSIAIFFIPSIVSFLISLLGENINPQCMICLLEDSEDCIEISNNQNSNPDTLCSIHDGNPTSCVSSCEYVNVFCQKVD